MSARHVIFDIGGVLIDWQPHLAWSDEMGATGAREFLGRIGFDRINLACDAGARFDAAAALLEDAEDAERLRRYVSLYTRTVPEKIPGTWDILHRLKSAGVPLHAITNWSAETWPEGLRAHPELAEVFGTTIVSGVVGVIKPSVTIFRMFCDRAGVDPRNCVFIDDGFHNCLGARAAGMDAIHFTGPRALEAALNERGFLP